MPPVKALSQGRRRTEGENHFTWKVRRMRLASGSKRTAYLKVKDGSEELPRSVPDPLLEKEAPVLLLRCHLPSKRTCTGLHR